MNESIEDEKIEIAKRVVADLMDVFNKHFLPLNMDDAYSIGMESLKHFFFSHVLLCNEYFENVSFDEAVKIFDQFHDRSKQLLIKFYKSKYK